MLGGTTEVLNHNLSFVLGLENASYRNGKVLLGVPPFFQEALALVTRQGTTTTTLGVVNGVMRSS
jgi:hypothetical protein